MFDHGNHFKMQSFYFFNSYGSALIFPAFQSFVGARFSYSRFYQFSVLTMCKASLRKRNFSSSWKELCTADGHLCLGLTLGTGQAFRWVNYGISERSFSDGDGGDMMVNVEEWAGVFGGLLIAMRGEIGGRRRIWWRRIWDKNKEDDVDGLRKAENALKDYFRTDLDMRDVMKVWCRRDVRYREVFNKGYGRVRLLRQDPVENLLAFICSSNNNIKRITGMVSCLAKDYGKFVGIYNGDEFYDFPSVDDLVENMNENDLREKGFGYRAKFIEQTVRLLKQLGGRDYLLSLRNEEDSCKVIDALLQFQGVGRKVAACIALMSLDVMSAVPVDTHVWQYTTQYYLPKLKGKSLTDRIHQEIGAFYSTKFGGYAGIAHNALFVAELSGSESYKHLLYADNAKLLQDTDERKLKVCRNAGGTAHTQKRNSSRRKTPRIKESIKTAFRVRKQTSRATRNSQKSKPSQDIAPSETLENLFSGT